MHKLWAGVVKSEALAVVGLCCYGTLLLTCKRRRWFVLSSCWFGSVVTFLRNSHISDCRCCRSPTRLHLLFLLEGGCEGQWGPQRRYICASTPIRDLAWRATPSFAFRTVTLAVRSRHIIGRCSPDVTAVSCALPPSIYTRPRSYVVWCCRAILGGMPQGCNIGILYC